MDQGPFAGPWPSRLSSSLFLVLTVEQVGTLDPEVDLRGAAGED